MDFDTKGLYFIPLGGSEQFGANLNVYICDGKLLAVDCGMGFADEHYPGIDLLLPDPSFLEENRDALEGLIITHAHEDHIGGVAYLWNRFRCPIYCTPFTAVVLEKKLEEAGIRDAEINVIEPLDRLETGPFTIEPLPVSHSVPDTCALIIETKYGRVLHSGDWNLDPNPVIGYKTDAKHFKAAGKKGVLAYVGDSTNANVDGRSGSERDVEKGLGAEFLKCPGRIIVTTFASNVGRLITIARAAEKAGRKTCVVGRSMHRMIGAAFHCGYMDDVPSFIQEGDLDKYPDEEIVIIATGSQGESRAATARIARGDFPAVTSKKTDTVIFSARKIPGNEIGINEVKNNFSAAGINVISPSDTDNTIHVSGHPCRDEIAEMFQWLRPEIVVPVHGEHTQLQAHADFASDCQVPTVILPKNGSVIKLAPGKPTLQDHIVTGLLAVDQKRIIPADHLSISQRRKLQYTGAVHVTVVLDQRGDLVTEPRVNTIGLIDPDDLAEEQFLGNMHEEILDLMDELSEEKLNDDHFITEELRIGVRRFCYHFLGIKPATNIHVVRV
ncbi:MAG: MBL fold hydrolase [Micavibrio sp.]|nr:MAG: MBL fold hydrolase [Micavibrio sp.]